jgi:molecular chaperone DnaK (HSP70)
VITNEGGDRTTPSFVSFTEDEHVVGLPAKQQMARNAKNTIFSVKRVIGKKCVIKQVSGIAGLLHGGSAELFGSISHAMSPT